MAFKNDIHNKFSICGDCVPEQYKAELMYVSSVAMTVNSMYIQSGLNFKVFPLHTIHIV